MLPFGVTIPATVPQGSEIPEGHMNNPVDINVLIRVCVIDICRNKQPSGKEKIVINNNFYFHNNL
jgi:hypothetical protein